MSQSSTEPAASKLIFVVGLWRSGTSLLHTLLNQHPQIALMYEAEPLSLWPHRISRLWPDDWLKRLDLFNQAITRHQFTTAALPKITNGREGYLSLMRAHAERKGSSIMGDKSPNKHRWLPDAARVFPEADFIVIWRDPADCCRSATKLSETLRFYQQPGIMTRTLFGSEVLARGIDEVRQNGRRVHELVYAELVKNPEAELRHICEFLKIPFDQRMLDLKSADFSTMPSGEGHSRVRLGEIKPNLAYDEVLSPALLGKSQRYAVLWRERFAHLGLARAVSAGSETRPPGMVERGLDQTAYFFWERVDVLKRLVFRNIPLPLWAWLRKRNSPDSTPPDDRGAASKPRNIDATKTITTVLSGLGMA